MKTPGSRPPHDTLQTALRSAFPVDARRLVVFTALVLAIIQARTVVLYSLKPHVALPGSLTTRYQRLIRFVQFSFPEGLFPRFALSFLPDGPLDLIELETRAAGREHSAALRRVERVQPSPDVAAPPTRWGQ